MIALNHSLVTFTPVGGLTLALSQDNSVSPLYVPINSYARINFIARVTYGADSGLGCSISERYGIDTKWGIGLGKIVPANFIFDNNTTPFARGSVVPPSGQKIGILQWNYDCFSAPALIEFTITNLDTAQSVLFELFGDVN